MRKILAGLFLILAGIDMTVKQYVEDSFQKNEERETKVPKLVIRKVYNKGFAFNFLDKYPQIIKWSSVIVMAGIAVYDVWLFFRKGRLLEKLGMVFLSAGAVSNTYDRAIRGKVIDYIGMKSEKKILRTTTANLADVYVVIGAVICSVAKMFRR